MSRITNFQRLMWLSLSYMSLCRFYIERDQRNERFIIRKAGKVRLFFYYSLWINSIIKIVYLILAYKRYLPVEVHFLDQMGMWDWFLCFSQLVQETNMWYRKYPMFEVLCANWKIQEDVFSKLGSPVHVEKSIFKSDKSLVKMHTGIINFGTLAIGVQFCMAPKYAANIYAVVPFDNWILRALFCAHEMFFIFHIWIHQACSIILCEVFASNYTHIMREMTEVLKKLVDLGVRQSESPLPSVSGRKGETFENGTMHTTNRLRDAFKRKYITKRRLEPSTKVPGTDYDIMTLLHDYEKMILASNSFNSWVGLRMGGTMGSNYSQFVSDVFMMIQLLKEPETDALAVFFYAEDACAGMLILFRMLIIISRLYPASQEFLQVLKQYLTYDTPLKMYLRKYQRRLRIISSRLGGYQTRGITVPKGINVLINWYICAAMWQRPKDRKT